MNSSIPVSHGRVAVLVDGENIRCEFAAEILERARQLGDPQVRRVYGNSNAIGAWGEQPGFKFVHTHRGKNSADIKLAVDAMELACVGSIDRFAIVSSDGDFSHLAFSLVERGLKVLGLGGVHASQVFRQACSEFNCIGPKPISESKELNMGDLNKLMVQIIRQHGDINGLKLQELGILMTDEHGLDLSKVGAKTWRIKLNEWPDIFDCDPKGLGARVRVKNTVLSAG